MSPAPGRRIARSMPPVARLAAVRRRAPRAGRHERARERERRRRGEHGPGGDAERRREQRPGGQAGVVGEADVWPSARPRRAGPARRSSHNTAALIIAPSPAPTARRETSNGGNDGETHAGATPAAITAAPAAMTAPGPTRRRGARRPAA